MTLLLSVRLHKTKAVIHSEKPYWVDDPDNPLDGEMKRRLELQDQRSDFKKQNQRVP